jgi:hypothetical protein
MLASSGFCPNCGAAVQPKQSVSTPDRPQREIPRTVATDDAFQRANPHADHTDRPPVEEAGFISNGEWYRPPGEFIRRVRQEDMRSNLLGGRSIRVPRGSVGVLFDGNEILEVVRPGNDITIGVLTRIWDRLKQLGMLTAGTTTQTDLYLIDVRPVPVPFTVELTGSTGVSTKVEVLVEASVRPDDRAGMKRLLDSELLEQEALTARGLYDFLSPRVQKSMRQLLATHADGISADECAEIEAQLRDELQRQIADAYGLALAVRVTPLAEMIALDIHLGLAPAPAIKQCKSCKRELRSTAKFCPSCGTEQPAQQMPSRTCPSCGYSVTAGKKFCSNCRHEFEELTPEQEALFTRDGQQVELDILARVSGGRADETRQKRGLQRALAAAAGGFLRERDYTDIRTPDGFRTFEQAMNPILVQAISAYGMVLVDVAILDIRSKQGEWELKARAELEQARKEALIGREWLEVEGQNLDLKAISLELALRQRQLELDDVFNRDMAELADRERRQEIADRQAVMDVADTRREVTTSLAQEAAVRELDRTRSAEAHADTVTATGREHELMNARAEHEMALETKVADHDAELARKAMALESEKSRRVTDDRMYDRKAERDLEIDTTKKRQEIELDTERQREAMKLEKLQAMAEIEARMTAQDNEHERQMREMLKGLSTDEILAMQAKGDEAVAAALAEKFRAEGVAAEKTEAMYERLLADRDVKDQQLAGMMQQFMQSMQSTTLAAMGAKAEAAAVAQEAIRAKADQAVAMSEKTMGAMSNVAAAAAGGAAVARVHPPASPYTAPRTVSPEEPRAKSATTPTCTSCGEPLEPPYSFCGACGTRQ